MTWTTLLILVAVLAVILLIRRRALVSAGEARRHLAAGAVIVDVRNAEEFNQEHLPGAINLPLPGLPASVLSRYPNKEQILLLHCLGGARSAIAQRLLVGQGYTHAHNLGSYGRAERIARSSHQDASSASASRPSQ